MTVRDLDALTSYRGLSVLVTGHSGFKGTWLSTWLVDLGAQVTGFSLPADTDSTNVAASTDLGSAIREMPGDVRDAESLRTVFERSKPDLVVHMAAQSLVRPSYADPVRTISTNVMGTVNVLEASRHCSSVRAIISVASDKCYEDGDNEHAYSETDRLGGADPYSASKGAAEVLTASYGQSFFLSGDPLLASVRAGNVLGAGDASHDRLIPDLIRSIAANQNIQLRNPEAVRPWQHVLEPLRAYLLLGAHLLAGDRSKTGSWNVGPAPEGAVTVHELITRMRAAWDLDLEVEKDESVGPPETRYLRLDTSKAAAELGFRPMFSVDDTVGYVVEGYRAQLSGVPLRSVLRRQIASYTELLS